MDAEANDTRTVLTPGAKLGPYEILGWLGQGGMGQVHRALDSRLGRNVAIKISAEQFSGRFEREARAISALNHPHVCTLYDVGPNYLVMELVEGETLAAQLARGPVPVEQVLRYGVQIADALAAAHSLGIIHRDLKPGNIMITRHGVKVLDFGLAKISGASDHPHKHEETLTAERAIVGTPAYMAPEQLRGEEVDARTDLFSFGALLYEMATGRRAFPLHLDRTPPPPVDTNADLRRVVGKLLEADRGHRYQSATEVLGDLERALEKPTRRWWAPALAGAGVAVAAIVLALLGWLGPARPPDRSRWVQVTKFPDSVMQPAFSPDGRMLTFLRGPNTFIGQAELYVKLLPDGEPVELTRDGTRKMSPAFSPDGSRIAYTVLAPRGAWDTWVLPVPGGGTPRLWLPNAEGLSWIDRQRLLFSEIKSGIHMAIATSLESRAEHRDIYVPAHENGMAHRSYLSPDEKWVLIVEMDERSNWVPCRLAPFDGSSAGKPVGPPGAACTSAAWSPDGKWMYLSSSAGGAFHLWRQRFPDGKPEQFTSGPTEEEGITVAPDGQSLVTAVGLRQRPASFHDAAGDRQVSSEGYTFHPLLYAGGRKVAYRMSNGYQGMNTPSEVWIADLDSGRNEPALPGFRAIFLDVSRDGKLLVCALDAGGRPRLWLAGMDRRSPPRQIGSMEAERALFGPPGVVFFLAVEGKSKYLFRIGEDGAGLAKVEVGPVIEFNGASPDGRWVYGLGPVPGREGASFGYAFPTGGGSPIEFCDSPCFVRWAPDGKYVFLAKPFGQMSGGAAGRTYVLPTRPGTMFPDMPAGGFRSAAELAAAPGARVIEAADVGPGPTPDVYVFSREIVQRNLYRIPLR